MEFRTKAVLWVLVWAATSGLAETKVVETKSGKIMGRVDGPLAVFRGIPYGAPPVGGMRWKPTNDPKPWSGILDTSVFKPNCMGEIALYGDGETWQPNAGVAPASFSEDCLYLNLWAPIAAEGKGLPVLFWIHGGANEFGGAADKKYGTLAYDGKYFAEQQKVIVVSINYRLGIYGFLAHPELTARDGSSGNYAVYDAIKALQWVKANVAKFGGDPERVLIFGQSAGGQMVRSLLTSPLAKGLFRAAVLQSPWQTGGITLSAADQPPKTIQGFPYDNLAEAYEFGEAYAAGLGCPTVEGSASSAITCLMQKADTYDQNPEHDLYLPPAQVPEIKMGWASVGGTPVLPRSALEQIAAGEHNKVPVIIGNNSGELSTLEEETAEWFSCPVDELADALANNQDSSTAPVYRYLFDVHANRSRYVVHGAEIPFVFNIPSAVGMTGLMGQKPYQFSSKESSLASQIQKYWTQLVQAGNTAVTGQALWPQWQTAKKQYLRFSDSMAVPVVGTPCK